jgi:hypothetical protein
MIFAKRHTFLLNIAATIAGIGQRVRYQKVTDGIGSLINQLALLAMAHLCK